jgi:hypothetical protein
MDPTQMSRDPSFDPNTMTVDVLVPSSVTSFTQQRGILSAGRRLARPAVWDQLGTLTGRRVRDSFMAGAGALSLPVMQRLRTVAVCETNQPSNHPAGLGALGYPDGGGGCQPFGASTARPAVACRPVRPGAKEQVCGVSFGVIPQPATAAATTSWFLSGFATASARSFAPVLAPVLAPVPGPGPAPPPRPAQPVSAPRWFVVPAGTRR